MTEHIESGPREVLRRLQVSHLRAVHTYAHLSPDLREFLLRHDANEKVKSYHHFHSARRRARDRGRRFFRELEAAG